MTITGATTVSTADLERSRRTDVPAVKNLPQGRARHEPALSASSKRLALDVHEVRSLISAQSLIALQNAISTTSAAPRYHPSLKEQIALADMR